MKIKVRYKSGVVAMNFRGKSKGSFENHRDVSSIVSNFIGWFLLGHKHKHKHKDKQVRTLAKYA